MSLPAFMTDHLLHERPERPQSYFQHGRFAMKHSLTLLVAGAAGVVHAISARCETDCLSPSICGLFLKLRLTCQRILLSLRRILGFIGL